MRVDNRVEDVDAALVLVSVFLVPSLSSGQSSPLVDVVLFVPKMCDFPLATADVDEEDGIGPLMLTARANVFDNSCLLLAPSSSDGRVDDEKPGTLFLAPY